ncbi:MAG: alpha/beta fold hydrolase [Xanthobacteraceae bacterium]
MNRTVVLIHGAWQGSWAWDALVAHLRAAGLDVHAVDLPGNGTDGTDPAVVSLELYVASVLDRIERIGGVVSVVAHSGGGIVASQLAEIRPDRIERLAYVAGMMLPDGVGFVEVAGPVIAQDADAAGIGPYLVWSADRLTSRVPPEAARRIFFHDCPAAAAETAASRLTPQPERGRAVRPRLSPERFGRVPRLYVEALADRSVVPAVQRRMQALVPGARVVSLPTGHAPQLAAPRLLAERLVPWLLGGG